MVKLKCKECGKDLSRSNKSGLCHQCYESRNKVKSNTIVGSQATVDKDASNLDESLPACSQELTDVEMMCDDDKLEESAKTLGVDLEGSLSDLKVRDLILIIREQYRPLRQLVVAITSKLNNLEVKVNKVVDEVADNAEKTKTISDEVTCLKNVILNQQKYLEALKRKETSKNLIISGIPIGDLRINNNGNLSEEKDKLDAIFGHIGCSNELSMHSEMHRITPYPQSETYSLKMCFKDSTVVKRVIDKAKALKNFKAAKIFLNFDTPYYSRKEHNRLRKKKTTLMESHVGEDIKVEKGKLYHNGVIVDQFDLSNQLF